MKPFLIHIHLFYPELWWLVKRYLLNLMTYPCRVYITQVEDHPDIQEDIEAMGLNATLINVVNRGYDVAPFLEVLKCVQLDDFSYVIKMHTKRHIPRRMWLQGIEVTGAGWRDYMYECFTSTNIARWLTEFENKPKLGMCANFRLIFKYEPAEERCWQESINIVRDKLGLKFSSYSFVAGSMFVCRAQLMKPIQRLDYTADDFEVHVAHNVPTLAHVFERIMGLLVCSQGYYIADCCSSFWEKLITKVFRFRIWQNYIKKRLLFNKKLNLFLRDHNRVL